MSLIIVNGLPGSGKSTLAKELSAALSLPLFSKDEIKEALADAIVPFRATRQKSTEWSEHLGIAAAEALWMLVTEVKGNAVIESPWLAHLRPIVELELESAGITEHDEVWCDVPVEIARQRFEERASLRHWIHFESSGFVDADWEMWAQGAEPLGLGTVHRVDTTQPVDLHLLLWELTQSNGRSVD